MKVRVRANKQKVFNTPEGPLKVALLNPSQLKKCQLEGNLGAYCAPGTDQSPSEHVIFLLLNPTKNTIRHELCHYFIEVNSSTYASIKQRPHGIEEYYIEIFCDMFEHINRLTDEIHEWTRSL